MGDSRERRLDEAGWRQTLGGIAQTPTVVFFWAPWSRSSVELLPSVVELEGEYPAVPFLYVNFESDDEGLLRRLDPIGPRYRLAVDYGAALEELGVPEPPAVRIYAAGGRVMRTLAGDDVTPDDIAAAIEQAAGL